MLKALSLCLCWFLLYIPAWAAGNPIGLAHFTDPVVSVLDGDTIEVLHNYTPDVSAFAH